MNKKDPFGFDMSVKSAKKKQGRRTTKGMNVNSDRICDRKDCNEPGLYRAPKSKDQLDEFWWFCINHIREYNQKWNFFSEMSDEELEAQLERDRLWERDTRPFKDAVHTEGRAWARFGYTDPHQVLGDNATQNSSGSGASLKRRLPASEQKALTILGIEDTMTKTEIRKVYKSLVKDLHPDMNGGRRDDEDRLREVVWAWETVKASRSFKE